MARDIRVSVRFNDNELDYIKQQMDKLDFKSRSKYIRYACLNGFYVTKTNETFGNAIAKLDEQTSKLNSIGLEINHTAKLLNSGEDVDVRNIVYAKKVLQDICNKNKVELIPRRNKKRVDRFTKDRSKKVRDTIIVVRLSKEEEEVIESKMKKIGVKSQSEYIRKMCINNFIVKVDNLQEQTLFKAFNNAEYELSSIQNNVNQIGTKMNFDNLIQEQDIEDIIICLHNLSKYNICLIDNTFEEYYHLKERCGANGLYKY